MIVNEEDYLAHYGRKGMKWYQHIYGEYQSGAKYAKGSASSDSSSKKSRFKSDEESDKDLLSRVVKTKSGDWEGWTEMFQKIHDEVMDPQDSSNWPAKYKKNRSGLDRAMSKFHGMDRYSQEARAIKTKFDDAFYDIVLEDLGYRKTKKGRDFLNRYQFFFY